MPGKKRVYYPGNNTKTGFFSYYDHILTQREANKIFCMKGGPGTGKSTFMRKIGEELLLEGYDVDFLMCSSDPNSLDGVIVKKKKIAIIDGTAPHVVDPKSPGAVDEIINLGEFWDEEGIRKNKEQIINSNEKIGNFFKQAYEYFEQAGKIHDTLNSIYDKGIKKEEVYKNTASIINKELAHKELNNTPGSVKKFFASAITPMGFSNDIESLVEDYRNVYVIETPVGLWDQILIEQIKDNVINRGFNIECFYCPMMPDKKIEHLLVPELSLAVLTSNEYHPVHSLGRSVIDMRQYLKQDVIESAGDVIKNAAEKMRTLLEKGIENIKYAKTEHDVLEECYIPHMNFDGMEGKRIEVLQEIKNR